MDLISTKEVQRRLHIGKRRLAALRRAHAFPAPRTFPDSGRAHYWLASQVEAWLEALPRPTK